MPNGQQQSGFDVNAARSAGYSDDEILQHLTQSRSFDVQSALKSGYSKGDIINYLAGSPASPAMPADNTISRLGAQMQGAPVSSFLSRAGEMGSNLLQGVGEGFLQPAYTIARGLNKIPGVGEYLAPSEGLPGMKQVVTPENTTQKVGAGLEQGAEMYATGGPLRELASAAPKLPWLARMAAEGVNTGANAFMHGQSPETGAAIGFGTQGLGEVASALAPKLAESALGVGYRMRGRGRAIGEAALDLGGNRPSTLLSNSAGQISDLTSELESRAAAASQSGAQGSTQPATQYLDSQIAKFQARNSPFAKTLQSLRDQLTMNQYTGQSIPQNLSPSEILELKRGVGDTINSWEPSLQKSIAPIKQRVYGLLDAELDRTVPGAADLNQQISSLIPVKQRAGVLTRTAPLSQRIAGRMAAHTGALTAAGIGGVLGYRQGGIPGALEYGGAGLVLPEVLASPTAQMLAARTAAAAPVTLPWLRGQAMQATSNPSGLPWRKKQQ